MLILSRKTGETLVMANGEIDITVLGVKGNQVRVGINAPKYVDVHRLEIFQKIQDEKSQGDSSKVNFKPVFSDLSLIDDLMLEHALLGDMQAEFDLGSVLYHRGQNKSAQVLLERAASKGHQKAKELLERLSATDNEKSG